MPVLSYARGLMCLLQTVLLTFAALFLLQFAYLWSVNEVNLGCFEFFGFFGQVWGSGGMKIKSKY